MKKFQIATDAGICRYVSAYSAEEAWASVESSLDAGEIPVATDTDVHVCVESWVDGVRVVGLERTVRVTPMWRTWTVRDYGDNEVCSVVAKTPRQALELAREYTREHYPGLDVLFAHPPTHYRWERLWPAPLGE